MDKKRILMGLLIATIVVLSVSFVPVSSPLSLLVLLAICGLGMDEFYALLRRGGMQASRHVGMISGLGFVVMTWFCIRQGYSMHVLWALLLLILLVNFFRLLIYPDAHQAIHNALGTLFGFIYVAFFWSFFVRIFMSGPLDKPGMAGLYLIATVKSADTGAYFIGSRLGQHKLFPRISPKKSWEGLVGGVACSCILGLLWWHFSGARLGRIHFPIHHALLLGIILPLIGTLGDLVESLFKRAVEMKDSGEIAPGLGGMLDMIDSLLFTAPFMYMYIEFFLSR
ncbi:MAG: phosphatidate cytidylyltransferase [Verrucomicrobiota bacterium]|jgi:phosphatidate cytidylyltransferase|nr:phosphatidate cytidylyltransferase [Verrucomicrobiota bacterium]